MTDDDLASQRSGLPAHLKVLLDDYPQQEWRNHANFSDLTKFWLDRHQMFRKALSALQIESEHFIDGERDPARYATLITRVGGFLIDELQQHHHFEDTHYFPILNRQDERLISGFDLLESDHQELTQIIEDTATLGADLVNKINAKSESALHATSGLLNRLHHFDKTLNRHLTDEEELIVPIILAYNPDLG